ncbi:MAG: prepilin-type N-terminal cleavage/methylation domain-containing protein [Candidatus Ryanbacteria bacterium]|nr:prepilin-type N-terminal cleavage/methylation domain-containing protein [Candidatus Ryanbacteria bacterium]
MRQRDSRAGFTLIELLVVIFIIGILAAIVLATVSSVRVKARDARRKADLNQIQKGLEFHYDAFGYYPTETACDTSIGQWSGGPCPNPPPGTDWANTNSDFIYRRLIDNNFIFRLSRDPINDLTYFYAYEPVGSPLGRSCYYILGAKLENESPDPDCLAGNLTSTRNYCVKAIR